MKNIKVKTSTFQARCSLRHDFGKCHQKLTSPDCFGCVGHVAGDRIEYGSMLWEFGTILVLYASIRFLHGLPKSYAKRIGISALWIVSVAWCWWVTCQTCQVALGSVNTNSILAVARSQMGSSATQTEIIIGFQSCAWSGWSGRQK